MRVAVQQEQEQQQRQLGLAAGVHSIGNASRARDQCWKGGARRGKSAGPGRRNHSERASERARVPASARAAAETANDRVPPTATQHVGKPGCVDDDRDMRGQ